MACKVTVDNIDKNRRQQYVSQFADNSIYLTWASQRVPAKWILVGKCCGALSLRKVWLDLANGQVCQDICMSKNATLKSEFSKIEGP